MNRLWAFLIVLCCYGGLLLAQRPVDIRNPDIDTETAEGALIADAAASEDPEEKLRMLETFAQKYGQHEAIGFALLQLQGLYLQKENFAKVVETGQKLMKIVPNDLEVRHNTIKGLEGTQDFKALLPLLVETKAIADKVAALPKPASGDEDEVAIWQSRTEYAQGVVQYIEYSLYTSALKATDPQDKIALSEALREHYPEGQYADQALDQMVIAYQQLGDVPKMAEAMEASLKVNPANESYLYSLAEARLSMGDAVAAQGYGEKLVELMEQKPMPEGMSAEDWVKHKDLFTAYGNYVAGKALVAQNKFREGRALMLQAVDPLKEQGGQVYGILAYYLGICYVKLDIGGDNIDVATRWMTTASGIEHPFQEQAKQTLAAIKKAQGQ